MNVHERVPLATLTSFHVGGPARFVIDCNSVDDIKEGVAFARAHNLNFYPLGEGSNVLAPDEGYDGVILHMQLPGIRFEEEQEHLVLIAGAGVSWDEVVKAAADKQVWGIENLAGIPGYMGAAPVQNIGAYGMEIKDTLAYVDVFNATTGGEERLQNTDCLFGYRDSRFKHDSNLIITSVALRLAKKGAPQITYGDLMRAKEEGRDLTTPHAIGEVVRAIRAKKFPDRAVYGTAGSFFKNPILTQEAYDKLHAQYGGVPRFDNPKGIKIPLAFVLDKVLGLRGYRNGKAWLFGAQPLVLVLDQDAHARDVETLAQEIETRVKEATNITIEREVRSMPAK